VREIHWWSRPLGMLVVLLPILMLGVEYVAAAESKLDFIQLISEQRQ